MAGRPGGRGPRRSRDERAARARSGALNAAGRGALHDLAVIVVSTNDASWLRSCLESVFAHAGGAELDVVVADNESTDGTRALVESAFPQARVVTCPNRGFAHANNRALMTCNARYVLFLNPDTELLEGTLGELVAALDERRSIGLVGVRQVTPDGELYPTIRRFPNALRALGEALAAERLPLRAAWLGERELDPRLYEQETRCDWTSGSFMLARREALESAGFLDERFFIYSEETDLCLRIRKAGWDIYHLPSVTILHHAAKAGINSRLEAQAAFAKSQYAHKNLAPAHRVAYMAALYARYLIRAAYGGAERPRGAERRAAARRALRVLLGREAPPFGPPPDVAVVPRGDDAAGPSARSSSK